jgi:hypothetical protein
MYTFFLFVNTIRGKEKEGECIMERNVTVNKRPVIVGVIGGKDVPQEVLELAEELGARIAGQGYVLMNGGGPGVMQAVSRGAYKAGGLIVGILPIAKNEPGRGYPNEYVNIPIYTDLADARNIIIAQSPDVIVAFRGGYGTLSEIALALKYRTPIVAFSCPYFNILQDDRQYIDVNTIQEAMSEIHRLTQVK